MMKVELHRIVELLHNYFDALYECDTGKLAEVFHDKALYGCIENGKLLTRDMQTYFPVVRQRVSSLSKGERRRDKIDTIDMAGSNTAMAKVHCAIGERYFTDYLSLLKISGEWKIISKVFYFDVIKEGNYG